MPFAFLWRGPAAGRLRVLCLLLLLLRDSVLAVRCALCAAAAAAVAAAVLAGTRSPPPPRARHSTQPASLGPGLRVLRTAGPASYRAHAAAAHFAFRSLEQGGQGQGQGHPPRTTRPPGRRASEGEGEAVLAASSSSRPAAQQLQTGGGEARCPMAGCWNPSVAPLPIRDSGSGSCCGLLLDYVVIGYCLLPGAWGFPPASRLPCLEARGSWLVALVALLAPRASSRLASSKQQAASSKHTRIRGYAAAGWLGLALPPGTAATATASLRCLQRALRASSGFGAFDVCLAFF
jgi:hypothetical protein